MALALGLIIAAAFAASTSAAPVPAALALRTPPTITAGLPANLSASFSRISDKRTIKPSEFQVQ